MIVYYLGKPHLVKSTAHNKEQLKELCRLFPRNEVVLLDSKMEEVKVQAYQIQFGKEV